jgi:hypothetical protein
MSDYDKCCARMRELKLQHGEGFLKDILTKFMSFASVSEFPGEKHMKADQNDPNNKFQKKNYNYLGPGTDLEKRLNNKDPSKREPINKLDSIAKAHDIAYMEANEDYKITKNRKQFIKDIHQSDNEFIEAVTKLNGGLSATLSKNLILLKKILEKIGIFSMDIFSESDDKDKNKEKTNILPASYMLKQEMDGKTMSGGYLNILIPLITTFGPPLVNKLYEVLFKNKQKGNGIVEKENKSEILGKNKQKENEINEEEDKFEILRKKREIAKKLGEYDFNKQVKLINKALSKNI